MRKYSIDAHRVHHSIRIVVTLSVLLCFLVGNVTGSAYYSFLMESNTAVTSPPVILQEGIAGSSTIYTNSTSAKVSVDTSPVENMNFTSDATGWVYGESGDVNNFASGAWSSTGGNSDPGCYDLMVDDNSAVVGFDVEQRVNYTFTVDMIPSQALIYASYRYTSDDDATGKPKIKLVRPDASIVDAWVGNNITLVTGSDTGYNNVSVDATSNFTLTGTYQLSLYTHTNSLKAAEKATVHNYWDDADVTLALDFNYVLNMTENHGSNWKVRLSAYDNSSLTRLDNCSIYIYDGSNSTQIVILNGDYENQTGPWYDLAASDTEYIWMHVETSSIGTCYVYAYLEIRVPTATTYARYVIAFEIS